VLVLVLVPLLAVVLVATLGRDLCCADSLFPRLSSQIPPPLRLPSELPPIVQVSSTHTILLITVTSIE
jgi:hypothetical protein